MMRSTNTKRMAAATRKIHAICGSMMKDMTEAKMNMTGARTSMRMLIWKDICTLVISVVRRVMSEDVEKRSILANEKVWILSYASCLRLAAKPALASEASLPPRTPLASDTSPNTNMMPP